MSDTPSTGAVVEAIEATEVSSHAVAAVAEPPRASEAPPAEPVPANGEPAQDAAAKGADAKRPRRARKAPARIAKTAPAVEPANGTVSEPLNGAVSEPLNGAASEPLNGAASEHVNGVASEPVNDVIAVPLTDAEASAAATRADAGSANAVLENGVRPAGSAVTVAQFEIAAAEAVPEAHHHQAPDAGVVVQADAPTDTETPVRHGRGPRSNRRRGGRDRSERAAAPDSASVAGATEADAPSQEDEVREEREAFAHDEARVREGFVPESERRPLREDGELPHDRFDPDAVKVVARLHQYGHEAYFVGGCVRDLILDRPPKDFDVATSATPNEVRNIFRNCRLIGRRFRLAHVFFKGGKVVEVSTFRANPSELEVNGSGGTDEQHADASSDDLLITHDNVFGTADEDARRRDFTMNGLFYDIESGTVLDFVNGRRDLERREIRTIGDPEVRMREDPVRILRAVRFAAKLGLDIESRTYAAMEGAVEDLSRCAPARLLEETFRLLRGGYAETSLKLLDALDALRVLLPPLGEAIRAGGKAAEARCWSFAAALDAQINAGAEFDDSVLLAALLVPIATSVPDDDEDGPRQTVGAEVEELLAELVQSARLPRRIAERSRQLLLAQRTLSGERRRRGGQAGFRRHPVFHDALRIFEMTVAATGDHVEALEAWKAGAAPVATGGARPASEGEGSKRPRRRRGRRRGGPSTSDAGAHGGDAE